jgi:chromosome transmission fidelity protein 1
MRWLDAAPAAVGGGAGAGRAHYEALCMRAVNQSIGRAIRHARDYAAIILADARWTKPAAEGGVAGKLPAWIAQSLVTVRRSGALRASRMLSAVRVRCAGEWLVRGGACSSASLFSRARRRRGDGARRGRRRGRRGRASRGVG